MHVLEKSNLIFFNNIECTISKISDSITSKENTVNTIKIDSQQNYEF